MVNFSLKQFDELDSTNIKAKELAAESADSWTVVIAKQQNRGYGRKGNAWFSPEGGLYFSVILPKSNVEDLQIITILAAFAVAKTIKEQVEFEPFVKLPNDVYLNGKKVCGIITENIISGDVKSSVMGIGLNTNIKKFPTELDKTVTSLQKEGGKPIDNRLLLEQIIAQLQDVFRSISQ